MKAAVYDTCGPRHGVLRVVELPESQPEPGEVCVRLRVSGVNPTDWKARERLNRVPWKQQIANQDGAGTVTAVGAHVTRHRVGDRVWVYHAALDRPTGTAAQYICLPAERVVALPDEVTFDHGAGLGIPGITAHHCVFADGPVQGRTVLVTGGAGAVGHAAIQLARWGGARVLTTVSSDEKAAIAKKAGAERVFNYREPGIGEEFASAASGGFDRVIEVAPATNLASYVAHLATRAVVVSYARDREEMTAPVSPLMRANASLRFVLVYGLEHSELEQAITDLTIMLQDRALRSLPVYRYPLDDIDAAHAAVRAGTPGKLLVDIP